MFDSQRLLDQFLGAGGQQAGQQPAQAGGQVGGQGGGLGSLLEGKGGLVTGLAAGGLLGVLMGGKGAKKIAKGTIKYGGMALVGGLAYKAWSDYQKKKAAPQPMQHPHSAPQHSAPQHSAPAQLPPPPQDSAFVPAEAQAQQDLAKQMVRAMIAAAKADGHINAQEQGRIFSELDKLPLDTDDKAFVFEELRKPVNLDEITAGITCPEQAAEIYAASLLAIDPSGPAERAYLGMLAQKLNLPGDLTAHIEASVAEQTSAA